MPPPKLLAAALAGLPLRLWRWLSAPVLLGARQAQDAVARRKIVLVNVSALMAMLDGLGHAALFVPYGIPALTLSALLPMAMSLLSPLVWLFNHRGAYALARVAIILLAAVALLCTVLLGQGTLLWVHYEFMLLAMVTLMLYPRTAWRAAAGLIALNVALFTFFQFHGWDPDPSLYALGPALIHELQVSRIVGCLALLFLLMLLTELSMAAHVKRLEMMGRTDLLTGLPNRRWFMSMLTLEHARSRRGGTLLALALADVDHFKRINDQDGHAVGDEALQHVAGLLRQQLRAGDFLARIGGEEFMVLMQVDGPEGARIGAERLRAGVASKPFAGLAGPRTLTISVGVAYSASHASGEQLMRVADAALYRAKQQGRDRVCMADADAPASEGASHAHG